MISSNFPLAVHVRHITCLDRFNVGCTIRGQWLSLSDRAPKKKYFFYNTIVLLFYINKKDILL